MKFLLYTFIIATILCASAAVYHESNWQNWATLCSAIATLASLLLPNIQRKVFKQQINGGTGFQSETMNINHH